MSSEYRFRDTLEYLDAGAFEQKVNRAVRDTCVAVAAHGDKGKKGKVVIELTIERVGESTQVNMIHALKTTTPTPRGKVSEENTTQTPLHVTSHGPAFLPNDQVDAFGQEVSRHE